MKPVPDVELGVGVGFNIFYRPFSAKDLKGKGTNPPLGSSQILLKFMSLS